MDDHETEKYLINNPEKQIVENGCQIWFFENLFYVFHEKAVMQISGGDYHDAKQISFLLDFYYKNKGWEVK